VRVKQKKILASGSSFPAIVAQITAPAVIKLSLTDFAPIALKETVWLPPRVLFFPVRAWMPSESHCGAL